MDEYIDKISLGESIPHGAIMTADALELPADVDNIPLIWTSSNTSVITDDGKVTLPRMETQVTLTATLSLNGCSASKSFVVRVVPKNEQSAYFNDNFMIPYVLTPDMALDSSYGLGTISWSGSTLVDRDGNISAPLDCSENITLTAVYTINGLMTSKTFMAIVLKNHYSSIIAYTRMPIENSYSTYMGYSMHIAYSSDSIKFQALNYNSGILFASTTDGPNNTLIAKGLKKPYLFNTADGAFGVAAVRIGADGSKDNESKGQILLWTSNDLIHFTEIALVNLGIDAYVSEAICEYNSSTNLYEILWCDINGNYYKNTLSELSDVSSVSEPSKGYIFSYSTARIDAEGSVESNVIYVNSSFGHNIAVKWSPLTNVAIKIQNKVIAKSAQDVKSVTAAAVYTDGSEAIKQVLWDTDSIDFSTAGTYEITGTVTQEKYNFPLAIGRADPNIIKWNGKYYFAATNENNGHIGLYVREADTISGLFAENISEYVILDKDESRGFIQTFWAPEFHIIGDNLYILFAVGGVEWSPQSHIMKLKEDGDITNPTCWDEPIRIKKNDGTNLSKLYIDGITLDMTYFKVNGISYYMWSWRSFLPADTGSMLYIATIDPYKPWQLTSEPVLIARPIYGWENNTFTINNEGPFAFITDEYICVTYSGGGAMDYRYVVGTLTAKIGANLLNPNSWVKSNAPVLTFLSVDKEYGPGHNSFTNDEYGNLLLVYHAKGPERDCPRSSGIRRVHFDIDGVPAFDMSANRDLNEDLTQVILTVILE